MLNLVTSISQKVLWIRLVRVKNNYLIKAPFLWPVYKQRMMENWGLYTRDVFELPWVIWLKCRRPDGLARQFEAISQDDSTYKHVEYGLVWVPVRVGKEHGVQAVVGLVCPRVVGDVLIRFCHGRFFSRSSHILTCLYACAHVLAYWSDSVMADSLVGHLTFSRVCMRVLVCSRTDLILSWKIL